MGQQFICFDVQPFLHCAVGIFTVTCIFPFLRSKMKIRRWWYFRHLICLPSSTSDNGVFLLPRIWAACSFFGNAARQFQRPREKKQSSFSCRILLIFFGVTFWRMFFFTYQNASYQYILLDTLKADSSSGFLYFLNQRRCSVFGGLYLNPGYCLSSPLGSADWDRSHCL
jgi:hypothetical protein